MKQARTKEYIKKEMMKSLLPDEISGLDSKKMTEHDMCMVIGWNLYREELFKRLNLINLNK